MRAGLQARLGRLEERRTEKRTVVSVVDRLEAMRCASLTGQPLPRSPYPSRGELEAEIAAAPPGLRRNLAAARLRLLRLREERGTAP